MRNDSPLLLSSTLHFNLQIKMPKRKSRSEMNKTIEYCPGQAVQSGEGDLGAAPRLPVGLPERGLPGQPLARVQERPKDGRAEPVCVRHVPRVGEAPPDQQGQTR